ncbi:Hypothetical predicted protein [Mytilus galloprovincialis]|uniref:Uncharacterized protein n=1 Tax=Mytilus galloprovincialis TaxID=29158 RepID=A0A8B6G9H2_MYTGA|nr:Hypothetical predicted protein [Mytilus galloprovincialis]
MENCLNVKNEIDKLYGNFVTVLHSEMDNHLPFKDAGGNVTKKRRKQIQKPYWNTELRELLTKVNRSEKDYLKYKGCKRTRDFLRSNFIEKRKQFDKRLRQCERTHQASIRDRIKNLNDSNPKFWREIDKLRPQKHRPDIDSVRMEDGSFSTDQETILKRWKSEYYKLFKLDNTLVNDTFIDNVSELTEPLEREFNGVTDEDDEILGNETCETRHNGWQASRFDDKSQIFQMLFMSCKKRFPARIWQVFEELVVNIIRPQACIMGF